MTDNEIIKALECCTSDGCTCRECPYEDTKHIVNKEFETMSNGKTYDAWNCDEWLKIDLLDLINRQKAEIERLSIELQAMRTAANSYKMHYENAKSICRGEAVEMVDYLIETLINSNGGAYSLLLMKLRNILTAMWIVGDIEIDNEIENKHATQKASEEA